MKKISIVIVALMMMPTFLNAQNEGVGYFAINGLFATGDFGDADANYNSGRIRWGLVKEDKKGGAGFGIGLYLGVWPALPNVGGLKFGVDMMFSYWWMNSDIRDFYNDYEDDVNDNTSIKNFELKLPHYVLLPFTFGLRYDIGAFHISGGLGYCLNMITNKEEEWKKGGKSHYNNVTYDVNMFSFAWRIGVGIKISDNTSLIASYYSMGTLKFKGEVSSDSSSSSEFESETHPTAFSVALAFSLKHD